MSNLPFVEQIIKDLCRFKECAEDDNDVYLERSRFDLLVQLGLLERVQRSPARWMMTQAGEDAIARSAVGEPLAWMTKPLRGSNAGKLCLCDPSEARDPELWATPFPVFATRRAAAVAAGEPVALSKEAISTIVGMVELCLDRRYCMGMDEGFKSFEPEVEHDFVKELRAFVEGAGKSFTAPPAAVSGDQSMAFEYVGPKKERRTVVVTREEVAERLDFLLFEKLTAAVCMCDSDDAENCRCDEYAEQFAIRAQSDGESLP